jgi:hypothetical protein
LGTGEVRIKVITLDTSVEELVDKYPHAVSYGIQNGVSFVFCVGAYPSTLGDLLRLKNVANPQQFVDGLNNFLGLQASHHITEKP